MYESILKTTAVQDEPNVRLNKIEGRSYKISSKIAISLDNDRLRY